uniref:Glycosyltransferase 2-like domain-containing protein n=1 Tax=Picocystis salinarum TaxID=88271 RepID=A0A7S3XET6_9CHLO
MRWIGRRKTQEAGTRCRGWFCMLMLAIFVLKLPAASPLIPGREWRKPSSYASMIGGRSTMEGTLMLYSLASVDPWASVYVAGTGEGLRSLQVLNSTRLLRLKVFWLPVLDKYDLSLTRKGMVDSQVWSQFQMEKGSAIRAALISHSDTLYMDADSFVLHEILLPVEAMHMELGLSPHYMLEMYEAKHGKYNGGFLWTKSKRIPEAWTQASARSRFFDQAALEELAETFKTFTFGKHVNLGWWQLCQKVRRNESLSVEEEFQEEIDIDTAGFLRMNGRRVDTLHAHLLTPGVWCPQFNEIMLRYLAKAPALKEQLEILQWAQRAYASLAYPQAEEVMEATPPFTIVVLTMNRHESLAQLLKALASSYYGMDKVDLTIKVDHAPDNAKVIDIAEDFVWDFGQKAVEVSSSRKGLARAWFDAWRPKTTNARGIVFEDDILLSKFWYRWLVNAWARYGTCKCLAGISLQRQTLVPKKPSRRYEIVNHHQPFLYPLVGSIGFSPHAERWLSFLKWIESGSPTLSDPATPDLVTYDWWRNGDKRQMWTQHFIHFCNRHKLFTLYINLPHKKTLAAHATAKGEHFRRTLGQDFATASDVSLIMPVSLNTYDWNAKFLWQICCSTVNRTHPVAAQIGCRKCS